MKPTRHAKGVDCKHRHIIEVTDIRQVNCPACRNLLRTNTKVREEFDKFKLDEKKKLRRSLIEHYKMPWGKHKGVKLEDVPFNYLRWLSEQHYCPTTVKEYVNYHDEYI